MSNTIRLAIMFVAVLILPLLTGCPTGAFAPPQVQSACPGVPGEVVNSLIIIAQEDRANGWSRTEELQAVIDGCYVAECLACATAVVDYVY
jgi:hypothetical protein